MKAESPTGSPKPSDICGHKNCRKPYDDHLLGPYGPTKHCPIPGNQVFIPSSESTPKKYERLEDIRQRIPDDLKKVIDSGESTEGTEGSDRFKASPERLLAFLDGSGDLEGFYFGEEHDILSGKFWWRRYLHNLRAPSLAKELQEAKGTEETMRQRIIELLQDKINLQLDLQQARQEIAEKSGRIKELEAAVKAFGTAYRYSDRSISDLVVELEAKLKQV